ncbi:hypothetical protein CVIRNUC_001656 [Coccomyxa viridis]|uniref:Cofactor assembly of complex C subunit B n=1 Tax=Coccomyxa viridis TaxID=1274662 RepID=A0AAV1HTT0_9CHLO|nr:hypothetical protein CVIRNUC_001656 [Coccomyxa viridis]
MLVHRPPLQCHLASAFQVHDKGRIRKHCALRVAKRDQQPSTTESLIDAQVLEAAPDEKFDWVIRYQSRIRVIPLIAGGLGILGVLANRLISGIAPVVDASSAQSRADVLTIGLSAVVLLTGLQWVSLQPRKPVQVAPNGTTATFISPALPEAAQGELKWMWTALQACSRCTGVVVIHRRQCVMHCGVARAGHLPGRAVLGPMAEAAIKKGSPTYMANLILFPGRVEFTEYFPENTQGILVQPVGDEGVLVAATDTQRGFGSLDQAWIGSIADKVDIALTAASEAVLQ